MYVLLSWWPVLLLNKTYGSVSFWASHIPFRNFLDPDPYIAKPKNKENYDSTVL
jgi:hypothetical protein